MEACSLILLCFLLVVSAGPVSSENCAGKGPCSVGSWEAWGPCQGTCGLNFQERTRLLCCPFTVQPRTLANCVHFCNITGGVTERRYCIDCGNGTTDYNKLSCLCQPLYKGTCCQGILRFFLEKDTIYLFLFNFYLFWFGSIFKIVNHNKSFLIKSRVK